MKALRLMALLPGLAIAIGVAHAQSFIGENITMGHYVPNDTTLYDGPYNVTVVAGPSDTVDLTASLDRIKDYSVNVDAYSVTIDFLRDVDFTAGDPFHGLIIDNLTTTYKPTLVESGSGDSGFSYDGSTMMLNWQGVNVSSGSTYTVNFAPVPEPTTIVGLGVLTLGAVVRRRRSRRNAQ